jgi:methylmalonyl-CoA mutase
MNTSANAQTFPPADLDDWRVMAAKAAGCAPDQLDEALGRRTLDGFDIGPLYGPARPAPVAGLKGPPGWQVIQRIDHLDPAEANAQALRDLEGGAVGLTIVAGGTPAARGAGLVFDGAGEIDALFKDVVLDAIAVRLDARGLSLGAAGHVIALYKRRGVELDNIDCDLGLDPLSAFAAAGRFPADYRGVGARLGDVAHWLADHGFAGRLIAADGRVWHEAGASDSLELACVLASMAQYLRDLDGAGLPLDQAAALIGASLAADDRQFETMAKFRAMRLIWARVCEACGLDNLKLHIHGETAWRMMTRKDAYLNLLRTTSAAVAATAGGADSLCVLPFSSAYGLPDAAARRLARNIQTILAEEAYLGKVTDPAAGAGAVEHLTERLAQTAWSRFQDFEAQGGIAKTIAEGSLQAELAASKAALNEAYKTGARKITGVTGYHNADDKPPLVLDPAEGNPKQSASHDLPKPGKGEQFAAIVDLANKGAAARDLLGAPPKPPLEVEAVTSHRLAEPFETEPKP